MIPNLNIRWFSHAFACLVLIALVGCDGEQMGRRPQKYAGAHTREDRGGYQHAEWVDTEETDKWLKRLSEIEGLKTLSLTRTDATDAGLVDIGDLSDLEIIHFNRCPGITDKGLSHLATATKVEFVVLVGTKVSDVGLMHLKDMKLQVLTVDGIGDAGLGRLTNQKALHRLDLLNCSIHEAGVEALMKMRALRNLSLYSCEIPDVLIDRLRLALPLCKVDVGP